MDMLRIGIMGVAGTLLAIQFKSGKSEYGIYITVVLSLIIFFSVLGHIGTIVEAMKGIGTLIKMLGITYIAEFSSGICKDAGYQTIASQIEIFGKLAVMLLSLPILMTLLNTIREFLS